MRVRPSRALLLLAGSWFVAATSDSGEERNVRGNFVITFPGEKPATADSKEFRIGVETLATHSFAAQSDSEVVFILMYMDYPPLVPTQKPGSRLAAAVGKTVMAKLDAVPTATTEFDDGSLKGQQFSFRGRTDDLETAGRLRLFLVENRLYQLLVWGPKESFNEGLAQDFFGSFKLLRAN